MSRTNPRVDIKSTTQVPKTAKESETALARLNASSKKHFGEATKHALGYGAALIGGAGVVGGLEAVVHASLDAEASQAKVRTALKNAGLSWSKYGDNIDKAIEKQAEVSGFAKTDLQDAFANMIRTTGSVSEALKLNGIAMDIARTKGTSLAGAQSLLARVYNGSFIGLKKLGIAIDPVTTAQDKLRESTTKATMEQQRAAKEEDKRATVQKALAVVQQKFAGQAQAYGHTTAGALDRMKESVNLLEVRLGQALAPTIAKVANKVATFINQMREGNGAGGRFADKMKQIAGALGAVLGPVKDVAVWLAKHPHLLEVAGAAWVAYKVAAVGQIAIVKAASLSLFGASMRTKLATEATGAGATTGKAFATKAGLVAAAAIGGWEIGKWLRANSSAVRDAGDFLGNAFGKAVYDKGFEWVRKLALGLVSPLALAAKGVDALIGKQGSPGINNPQTRRLTNRAGGSLRGSVPQQQSAPTHRGPKHVVRTASTSSVRAAASSVRGGPTATTASVTGPFFSQPQIAQLWVQAGGSKGRADLASAVAMAESSGGAGSTSSNPAGGVNRGLWQIWSGNPGSTTDPLGNARGAVSLSHNGTSWGIWETYVNGAYRQYLGGSGGAGSGATAGGGALSGGGGGGSTVRPAKPKPPKVPVFNVPALPWWKTYTNADLKSKPVPVNRSIDNPLLQAALTHVQNQVAAGVFTQKEGDARQIQILQNALDAKKGLKGEDRLVAQGMIRSLQPAAADTPSFFDTVEGRLSEIDLQVRAGDLTPDQGVAAKRSTITDNLGNPGLSPQDVLELRAELGDLKDAVTDNSALLQQQLDMKQQELDNQTRIADIMKTQAGTALGAVADLVSGQIAGIGFSGRALTAGAGSVYRS